MSEQLVTIDLPPPLSVNATRRIDWSAKRATQSWVLKADALVILAKCRRQNPLKLEPRKRFELEITFSEDSSKLDLDNGLKLIIDYLHRIELIEDDSPRHLRRITVQWGHAPIGTRVKIIPHAPDRNQDPALPGVRPPDGA